MNWKGLIEKLNEPDSEISYRFNPPAHPYLFHDLMSKFNLQELPDELIELYSQTNGVNEVMERVGKIGEVIWPIERVIATNHEYRNDKDFAGLYMSFDQLLFVSDAGNGDLFGYVTLQGRFDRYDIFTWNHENDSRTWVAPNLSTFVEWWADGKIKV